jgi:hypothetical protein
MRKPTPPSALVLAARVARQDLGEAALDQLAALHADRARRGGHELDVPAGHLAMEGAARARKQRVVGRLAGAARQQQAPALGVHQQQLRLEGQPREMHPDRHAGVLRFVEHARDLRRIARHEPGNGVG